MVKKIYLVWGLVVCVWLSSALGFGWQTAQWSASSGRGSSGFWYWGGGK
jgi:hypothetical protein